MGVRLPQLRLENNGIIIPISSYLPVGYLKRAGAQGFGIAPTQLTMDEGAGDGEIHRNTRRGGRLIDLPIAMQGANRAELKAMMRQLTRCLQDHDGPARLYYVDPEDGEELFTYVHYAGGGDHTYGVDTNMRTFVSWTLSLRSTSAYWTSTEALNFSLSTANAERGLLKNAPLTQLQLASSSAIGTFVVTNPGDVDAYPVWTIRGPGDSFTATRYDGQSFSYEAAITNADPVTIDTLTGDVLDLSGDSMYGNMGTAPKLFSIPPGESTIDIVMTGTDATSLVSLYFSPRYEVVL